MIDNRQVLRDNIRDHQIGGKTDGISREVAEDLGFIIDPDRIQDILYQNRQGRKAMGRQAVREAQKPALSLNEEIDQRIRDNAGPWGPDFGGK